MLRIGFGLGLLALTVVGCASGEQPGMSDDVPDDGLSLGPIPGSNGAPITAPGSDVDESGDVDVDADPTTDPSNGDPTTNGCTCDSLPGIDVGKDGTITVHVPKIGDVVVKPLGATCKNLLGGIQVTGDIDVDLGTGKALHLLDADLMLTPGKAGGLPGIDGDALLDRRTLVGMLPSITLGGPTPVGISLDTVTAMTGGSGLALDLALPLDHVPLPQGDLPALADGFAIADADVLIASDGLNSLAAIQGTAEADVTLLRQTVPLDVVGNANAHALIENGTLLDVYIDGHVGLRGNELMCGLTPVAGIDLPQARLVIDHEGVKLDAVARAAAALNPILSAEADADVRARITRDEFYIRVCADAVADAHVLDVNAHADADATICLALTPVGPETCSCKRGEQTDDDGGPDREY